MQALRDRNYLTYLVSNAVSLIGDAAYFVALGWAAAQLSDPLLTSLVLGAGSIPRALLLIPAGAIADRHGPRRIMLGGDLARAGVMLAGAFLMMGTQPQAWALAAIALVFGIVDGFYMPAQGAFARFLVRSDEMPKVSAIGQVLYRLTAMVGAPVGGILVATGDFALACLVNGITFAVVFLALLTVKPRYAPPPVESSSKAERKGQLGRDLVDGLRYLRNQRTIRTAMIAVTAINIGVAPIAAVGLPLRVQAEGWGGATLGLLEGIVGLGGMVGAVGVLLWRKTKRPAFWGIWWILLQSACALSMLVMPGIPATAVVCAIIGSTFGIASALIGGFIGAITDPVYMGRIGSVGAFASWGLTPVAYVVFGGLVGWIGLGWSAFIFAMIELATAIWALASPDIRNATMPTASEPAADPAVKPAGT